MISHKLATWDGHNKQKCRSYKVQQVAIAKARRFLPVDPTLLSLAGSSAIFERALVARGLIHPEDITTIQSPRKRTELDQGTPILHSLIKMRNDKLPGMRIWPEDFSTFSKGYKPEIVIPHFYGAAGKNAPLWFKIPKFREEMENFITAKFEPFSILDIDLCGAFSQNNGEAVSQLFQNQALAETGLFFINHQKGRDITSTNVLDYLKEYFKDANLNKFATWNPESYEDSKGNIIDLNSKDELTFYQLRYILVPIYYMLEAFNNGYLLEFYHLFEYRDRSPKGGGPNMLQWFANFERHGYEPEDYETFYKNLSNISEETYAYTTALD